MVYERVTGAISETSVHARPDKRWLGLLLCAVSAVLTLALGGILATSVLTNGGTNMAADGIPALERFQPAAGPGGRN
jgi:predicted exporter